MHPYGPPPPGYGRPPNWGPAPQAQGGYPQQQQHPAQGPAGYGPPRAPGPPPPQAQAIPRPVSKPLARLPLQIGTTSTWSAARAAIAIFPGLACILIGVLTALLSEARNDDPIALTIAFWPLTIVLGPMLVAYGAIHFYGALKNRASDVLLHPEGLVVDGGRLHGTSIAWQELYAPFATVEEAEATRLVMWRMLLFTFWLVIVMSSRGNVRWSMSPLQKVTVWKLWILRGGQPHLVAQTDREIEADSMHAAAASIEAVMTGRRHVEEAPAVATQVTTCPQCGAPAVPDDAPAVPCAFCRAWVQLPPQVRGQAATTKALQASRQTQQKMVAKLLEQPRAANTNAWTFVFALLMFGAWPLGWGLIAWRVLDDGFQAQDAAFLLLPFSAVIGAFFLARARLADRGALQMLTLGFGALAPRREGEPSRCRRCQAPLPDVGLGGVAQCRYCASDNIVGLDLRPSVDEARAEAVTFDQALKKRASEKLLWGLLTAVAIVALLGWIGGVVAYVVL